MSTDRVTITIRRRPWWHWTLAVLTLCLEALLVQTAWASINEEEYRAAAICSIAFAVLAAAGIFFCLRRPHGGHPL